MEIEEFAKELHNYYEERAEVNNWETQKSCKVEFEDLPIANKQTMIDLASYIKSIESIKIQALIKENEELKAGKKELDKRLLKLAKECDKAETISTQAVRDILTGH